MFARILLVDVATPGALEPALAALERFSGIGTIIVAAIVATGSINLLAIVGTDKLAATFATTYGRLLLIKLALFGAMLGLAGVNRWRLVPAIRATLVGGEQSGAVRRLRRTILAESILGLLVLAVVAILGTLSPVD
jgi:putative copper resistance protein D